MTIGESLSDADRSRLENLKHKLGGGTPGIYAIFDRKSTMVVLVVATCSEDALDLCDDIPGCEDWTLANTNCRRVMRNVVGEPEVITAYALMPAQPHPAHTRRSTWTPAERNKRRADRRKAKRARERAALTPPEGT